MYLWILKGKMTEVGPREGQCLHCISCDRNHPCMHNMTKPNILQLMWCLPHCHYSCSKDFHDHLSSGDSHAHGNVLTFPVVDNELGQLNIAYIDADLNLLLLFYDMNMSRGHELNLYYLSQLISFLRLQSSVGVVMTQMHGLDNQTFPPFSLASHLELKFYPVTELKVFVCMCVWQVSVCGYTYFRKMDTQCG